MIGVFYVIGRQTLRWVALIVLVIVAVIWTVRAGQVRRTAVESDEMVFAPQYGLTPGESTGGDVVAPTSSTAQEGGQGNPVEVRKAPPSLAEYRLERDRARSRRVELLNEIVRSSDTPGDSRREAQAALADLLRKSEQEVVAESLVNAQGFPDALVIIEESGVNVVIAQTLDGAQVARVGDAVARAAGVSRERVTILDGGV